MSEDAFAFRRAKLLDEIREHKAKKAKTKDPMDEMWFGFQVSIACLCLGIVIGLFLGGI